MDGAGVVDEVDILSNGGRFAGICEINYLKGGGGNCGSRGGSSSSRRVGSSHRQALTNGWCKTPMSKNALGLSLLQKLSALMSSLAPSSTFAVL